MKVCYKCNIEKPIEFYLNDSIICIQCHDKRRVDLLNEAESNLNKNVNCVYAIKCLANNSIYVGSSNDFNNRLMSHKNSLIGNRHYCKPLQVDFNKYGLLSFDFYIIEHNLLDHVNREYEIIKEYMLSYNLYNTATKIKKTRSKIKR